MTRRIFAAVFRDLLLFTKHVKSFKDVTTGLAGGAKAKSGLVTCH